MKIKINCSVENLRGQGLPLPEAQRLAYATVDASRGGHSSYYSVPGTGRDGDPRAWLFSDREAELVTLDLTRPVQTRDGRPVEIKFIDDKLIQPVVGIIAGKRTTSSWLTCGRWSDCNYNDGSEGLDLVNVPEAAEQTRVAWINVYNHPSDDIFHRSKDSADATAGGSRIACVRVEYTFTKGAGL